VREKISVLIKNTWIDIAFTGSVVKQNIRISQSKSNHQI